MNAFSKPFRLLCFIRKSGEIPIHFLAMPNEASCEPNNQLNVCTTSVTEGEVAGVKLV